MECPRYGPRSLSQPSALPPSLFFLWLELKDPCPLAGRSHSFQVNELGAANAFINLAPFSTRYSGGEGWG